MNAEIQELAEFIAQEFWKGSRVELINIAKTFDITFSFGRYENCFDGLLECKDHRFHIYINLDTNRSADAPRARFSFAHELGHYFIDRHRHALDRGIPSHGSQADFESGNRVEHEADLFAANLLLPRERIRVAASRCIDAKEVERLSRAFGTSLSATAIRCAQLSLAPIIVMRWGPAGRAWCWSSEGFERVTGNKAFRALDKIAADSVTRQTLDRSAGAEGAVRSRGTTLASWFPAVRAGGPYDSVLIEECIGLGPHGVLTVLHPA